MAAVTGVLTTVIQNRDRAGRDYQEKVERIEEYMKFQKLPTELRYMIRDYFIQKFRENKIFDETEIVSDLSPQLKTEVYKWNKRDLINKTPLFSEAVKDGDVERSVVSAIVTNLQAQVSFEGDIVMHQADPAMALFFIHSGLENMSSFGNFSGHVDGERPGLDRIGG